MQTWRADTLTCTKENMTYKQLAEWISRLTPLQQECNVSVFLANTEEYIPLSSVFIEKDTDVLDKNHPVLEIDF